MRGVARSRVGCSSTKVQTTPRRAGAMRKTVLVRRANGLPLTRPRAFRFPQRDAQRRAETRRVSAGPTSGTRSGAAAELCRGHRNASTQLDAQESKHRDDPVCWAFRCSPACRTSILRWCALRFTRPHEIDDDATNANDRMLTVTRFAGGSSPDSGSTQNVIFTVERERNHTRIETQMFRCVRDSDVFRRLSAAPDAVGRAQLPLGLRTKGG